MHGESFQCSVCLRSAPSAREQDGEWLLLQCTACGSARLEPIPTLELAEENYGDSYRPREAGKRFIELIEVLIWLFHRRRFVHIRRRNPRAASILDIGCGRGDLLEQFRKIGWRVAGTELNRRSIEFNRERGIDVRFGGIEAVPEEPFDVITLFHVLEHLPDLSAAMMEIERRSKPGTQLVIEIPNALSPCHVWFRGAWFGRDLPNHLHQINPNALAATLEARGWTLEAKHQWSWEFGFFSVGQSFANAIFPRWHNRGYQWLQKPDLRPARLLPALLQLFVTGVAGGLYPLLFVLGAKRGISEVSQLWFRRK